MAGVLDFDLSPSWCGWCAGDGSRAPEAGAFLLRDVGLDLGAMAMDFRGHFLRLYDRFEPQAVGYEGPIKKPHDALLTLRHIYGLGFYLEGLCASEEINLPCGEIDLRRIKNFMTGDQWAEKPLVAAAAEGIGIILPPKNTSRESFGRLDAGDAAGAWMVHLSEFDPPAASPWIAKLRGSLL